MLIKTLKAMLPLAAAVVCTFGIIFWVLQQYIRLSANETSVQYAENVRSKLEKGMTAQQAAEGIELTYTEKSLMPFVMICDKNGNVLLSTSALYTNHPVPVGVLNIAKQNGENRRTWQPARGLRNAIVVLPWSINGKEGYVIGGKSMRETEQRERFLSGQIVAGLIVTLLVTFACTFIVRSSKKEPPAAL